MYSTRPINGEVLCSLCSHHTTGRITPQEINIKPLNITQHSFTTNISTSPMSSRTKQTTHKTSYGLLPEVK
jgi:hypothetical protein